MDDVQNRFARELADAVAAAVAQSADVERCRELNIAAYLNKPSSPTHLHEVISRLMGRDVTAPATRSTVPFRRRSHSAMVSAARASTGRWRPTFRSRIANWVVCTPTATPDAPASR